jgi:Spy/CpxP family protein refolding chaperone
MKNITTRMLTIAVVLLLLTNIALVFFMMRGKKSDSRKDRRQEPMEMMIQELNMTEQQQKEYKQLKEAHFEKVRPLFDSVRSAKIAFFALIKEGAVSDSVLTSRSQEIYKRQAILDKSTFEHFKRVRTLFTPEQQPKFDEFVKKMMQRGRRDSVGKKDK